MARINKELLATLVRKTGLSQTRVYELISDKAATTLFPRHLAALALAAELGINISKKSYATDEERKQLIGTAGSGQSRARNLGVPATQTVVKRKYRSREPAATKKRKSNLAWVVHGRNLELRDSMYSLLRSLGLTPIEWNRAVKATRKAAPYIGEILDKAFEQAAVVIILLTPDDEARLRTRYLTARDPTYDKKLTGQARPNVLFEAGLAFGSHPDRTILVEIGDLRPFSDVAGRHVSHLSNDVASRLDFIAKLEAAGCAVERDGTSWINAGDFSI